MKRSPLLGGAIALTTLIACAALGFASASEAGVSVSAFSVNQSGTTSATANTFTVLLLPNTNRNGCLFENTSSANEYIFVGAGTATEANSFLLAPNATFNCSANNGGVVIADELQIAGASTSQAYAGSSQ